MSTSLNLLVAIAALTGPPEEESTKRVTLTLEHCRVALLNDVQVPAQEQGLLTRINARPGASVKANELLATVDDSLVRSRKQVVALQHLQAKEEAGNDINVRYAQAASLVSHAEHEEAVAANRIAPGAIAAAEVRRLKLTAKRADLQIEQSQMEHRLAGLTYKVRGAELKAVRREIRRRRITAPIDGVVVEVLKVAGEWVAAGEPVLRLVRMDRLRVEGFVNAAQFGDEELVDQRVKVVVQRQRGQSEEFTGKITFVNPLVEAEGNYRVWAEVDNRQHKGRWLLRPGMAAQMKIELVIDAERVKPQSEVK